MGLYVSNAIWQNGYEYETLEGQCPHGKDIIHYRDTTPGFRENYTYCRCNICKENPPYPYMRFKEDEIEWWSE